MPKTFSFGPQIELTHHQHMAEFQDRRGLYQQVPIREPEITCTVYGYPVTIDKYPGKYAEYAYRVAAWMPGEERRTRPLVEERLTEDVFRETAYEYGKRHHARSFPMSERGIGLTECFLIEWATKNQNIIRDAADRRSGNPLSYTDLGINDTPAQIPTRTFKGEDGQTYTELDLRGEDTDPVLLQATKDRDRILAAALEAEQREKEEKLRRIEEGKRRLRELQEKRDREQAELEAMPGYGSF